VKVVLQRVREALVKVDEEVIARTGPGLLILLGVGMGDTEDDLKYLADKIIELRIFEDGQNRMNLSVRDVGGEIMVVSQFTLYGDCRKGRRPSFTDAAPPEEAERFYNKFIKLMDERGMKVAQGKFQARMQVELVNDGPVTIILDSRNK
jgi:D-tyrosyl-tRNA(Tyr) deacylase